MILQVELYWLCHAFVSLLESEDFTARRLELLAKRQAKNIERLDLVASDMSEWARSVPMPTRNDYNSFGMVAAVRDHSFLLLKAASELKQVNDRALLLSYVQGDPNMQEKLDALRDEYKSLAVTLSWLGWDSPLRCSLAVDNRGRFVNSPRAQDWLLYPEMTWGCFCAQDATWLAATVRRVTGEQQCHYIHPVDTLSKLNVPNYFLWSCIQQESSNEQDLLEVTENLTQSMLAYVTEDDKGNVEDNSPFPTDSLWGRVALDLPLDVVFPIMPVKKHECCHDVLASREAISSLQMHVMQRIY